MEDNSNLGDLLLNLNAILKQNNDLKDNINSSATRGENYRSLLEEQYSNLLCVVTDIQEHWNDIPETSPGIGNNGRDTSAGAECCKAVDKLIQCAADAALILSKLEDLEESDDVFDIAGFCGMFPEAVSEDIVPTALQGLDSNTSKLEQKIAYVSQLIQNLKDEDISDISWKDVMDELMSDWDSIDDLLDPLKNLQREIPSEIKTRYQNLINTINPIIELHPLKHIEGFNGRMYLNYSGNSYIETDEKIATFKDAADWINNNIDKIEIYGRLNDKQIFVLSSISLTPSNMFESAEDTDSLSNDFVVSPQYAVLETEFDINYYFDKKESTKAPDGVESLPRKNTSYFEDGNNLTSTEDLLRGDSDFVNIKVPAAEACLDETLQQHFTYHIDNFFNPACFMGFIEEVLEKSSEITDDLNEKCYSSSGDNSDGRINLAIENSALFEDLKKAKDLYDYYEKTHPDFWDYIKTGASITGGMAAAVTFGTLGLVGGVAVGGTLVMAAASPEILPVFIPLAIVGGATMAFFGGVIGLGLPKNEVENSIGKINSLKNRINASNNALNAALDLMEKSIVNIAKKYDSEVLMQTYSYDIGYFCKPARIKYVNGPKDGQHSDGLWYCCDTVSIPNSVIGTMNNEYILTSIGKDSFWLNDSWRGGATVVTWEYNVREEETTNTLTSEVKFWDNYDQGNHFNDEAEDIEYSCNTTTINKINNTTDEIIDTRTTTSFYPSEYVTMPVVEDPVVVDEITVQSGAYWIDMSNPSVHYSPGEEVYVGDRVAQGQNVNFELCYEHDIADDED